MVLAYSWCGVWYNLNAYLWVVVKQMAVCLYSNVRGLRKRHIAILYQTKAKSAVDAAHRRAFLTQG